MKNKVVILLAVAILFLVALFTPLTTKVEAASKEGVVTVSSLNIREKSSATSKVLGTIKKGQAVTIIMQQSNWSKIKYGSKTGWVSSKYINEKGYVTVSSLYLRMSGSTKGQTIATLKKGTAVQIISQKGDWLNVYVSSNKKTGWVSKKYISSTYTGTVNTSTTTKYYVTVNSLNIRQSASASSTIITSVNKGDSVTYYSKNGNWANVKTASGKIGWAHISYLSTTKPPVDSTSPSKGLKGKVIVIDPGHGGNDPGAIGEENNEKDLTLSTANKVKAKLESLGAKVVMTRAGDTYPTLSERVKISEKNNADVFISIHFNSEAKHTASGIETYFWKTNKDESKLASLVQQEIVKSTGLKNRKVAEGNFQVIRENTKSAILVELGFISNPDEEKIIETNAFQDKAATGIVNGLVAYFNL